MIKTPLLDLNKSQLIDYLTDLDQPRFRARQLWNWLYQRHVDDFEAMTNLPKSLRAQLAQQADLSLLTPIDTLKSSDGFTLNKLAAQWAVPFAPPDKWALDAIYPPEIL